MPRYWGNWTATSSTGARYRLGMDWSRSGTRVTVDQYLFESAFSIHKSITLTRTGRLSGTYSVSVSTSGGVVSLGRGGSVTGSRGGSVTIGGRATNVLHGLVPTFSHTISIPAVAPSAPGRPSVSNITHNSVRAAWSAPSNSGGAPVTNYQFQIARNSSFTSNVSTFNTGTTRSRTQPLGDANQAYWIRIRARNSAGYGPWSSSRSFTSLPLGPNTPSNANANRLDDNRIRITWSRNATSARPYASQRVYRRHLQANGAWSNWVNRSGNLSGTATAYVDSAVGNWQYQYYVQAYNDSGGSGWATTGDVQTSPAAPTNLRITPGPSGNRLRWSNSARYMAWTRVERQEEGGSWQSGTRRGDGHEEWTHSNPDLAVRHRYRVRHESQLDDSLTSSWTTSGWVRLAAPPSAPTNLGPSGVWDASEDRTLTWRHVPTDDSEQERFQVRHRLQGGSWTTVSAVASGSEQWTLPGGTYAPGDVIEWQVRTWGVHPDPGPYSASNFQSPTSRPTVAINEPVDGSEIDTSSVLVTWGYSGPEQDDGDEGEVSGQAAWRLTVLRGSNVVTEESGSDDRDEFLVRGLSDDATYTIRVEVRSGEGLWSAEPDEVTISVSYLPPAPPQIGVAFDRDLGAAVVDVQTAAPHEPYEYVNVVTNPRGRPADTSADADPLAARQFLLDALAAYTDAPVQWSTTEPGDTSVVWVDPGTGEARQWSAGAGGSAEDVTRTNLFYPGTVGNLALGTIVLSASSYRSVSVPVTPGQTYGVARNEPLTNRFRVVFTAEEPAAGVEFFGGTGNSPSTDGDTEVEVTAPEGAAYMLVYLSNANEDVESLMVEPGGILGAYFDGDTPERRTDNIIYRYAWDGTPHASPSTETALGQGWYEITDPDVVAAGQEYADAVTALAPVGWDGAGIWWSVEHDAVYVPQGVEATVPTAALPDTVTLVLLDAETGESAQYWDHTSATIPADTAPRYLRAAIVEGEFVGPYFDGGYPRGAGQDGSLATYTWDDEPHDSATTATITSLETESVQLWRAIDDGPWLLIADGVPPDTAISDPIPAIGDRRVNHYRATSVSGIGSAMHSEPVELVVSTHGPGGNHGWVYVNGGPDFSDMIRVRANATRSGSQGLAKGVRRYAGNPMAQERSGTAEHRTWSIGVNAREALYEDGMSRPEDIDRLQRTGGVVCYRDPLGARWFASMGMMDDSYRGITGEVSWPMEEVDQPEGLATEARDQSHGDEDDDPGEEEPE